MMHFENVTPPKLGFVSSVLFRWADDIDAGYWEGLSCTLLLQLQRSHQHLESAAFTPLQHRLGAGSDRTSSL